MKSKIVSRKKRQARLAIAGLLMGCALAALNSRPAGAQIRSGAAFLKMIPGARQHGLSGSLAGAIDNTYALYANPGAAGFLREWQWSAAYTRWIPDIYNATFFYGGRLAMPWSRHFRAAIGVSYLGIPDFDSSNGRAPLASGGDVLVTAHFGQPLHALHRRLAFGGSLKFLRSDLNGFTDHTFVYDAGVLWRTPTFSFLRGLPGLLDQAIFSAGLSVTQLGRSLNFQSVDTPLPRTLRAGASLNMGAHDGLQVHLSVDFRNIRGEPDFATFGTEISFAQFVTLRGGYRFEENNLLQQFTIGGSIAWNDVRPGPTEIAPLQNKALRLDLVLQEQNDFFRSPYRGSVDYVPIRPERFAAVAPAPGGSLASHTVALRWEEARDPDIFDAIRYWVLVDAEEANVQQALGQLASPARAEMTAFLASPPGKVKVSEQTGEPHFVLANLECGDYFWSVVAFDKDDHFRVISTAGQPIARFRVALPDLQITRLREIREEESRLPAAPRRIEMVVANRGEAAAADIPVDVRTSSLRLLTLLEATEHHAVLSENLLPDPIPALAPGDSARLTFTLPAASPEMRFLLASLDRENRLAECDVLNNDVSLDLPPVRSDLSLTKSASRDSVVPGDRIRYSLEVWNHGPGTARQVTVTDTLPSQLRLLSAEPMYAQAGAAKNIFVWQFDSLPVNTGAPTATISYEVEVSDVPAGSRTIFKMDSVVFNLNRDTLTPYARSALDAFVPELEQFLQEHPGEQLEIAGHTDSLGTLAYNDGLSLRRATSVYHYLAGKSQVFKERLRPRGYGERKPLVPNSDKACRRLNRRVEIRLPGRSAPAGPLALVNLAAVRQAADLDTMNNRARATVLAHPATPETDTILRGVNFEFDRAALRPESRKVLDTAAMKFIDWLAEDSTLCIEIAGHTDSKGSDEYNLGLSQRRAERVVSYLKQRCIWPGRIFARGYGETRPIADNDTEAGRAKNRRVAFTLHRGGKGNCAANQ